MREMVKGKRCGVINLMILHYEFLLNCLIQDNGAGHLNVSVDDLMLSFVSRMHWREHCREKKFSFMILYTHSPASWEYDFLFTMYDFSECDFSDCGLHSTLSPTLDSGNRRTAGTAPVHVMASQHPLLS